MQYTTDTRWRGIIHVLSGRIFWLGVLCFLVLALWGRPPVVAVGWFACPTVVYNCEAHRTRSGWMRSRRDSSGVVCQRRSVLAWQLACQSWHIPFLRSVALALLWQASGQVGPIEVIVWPWVEWIWVLAGVYCPFISRQPEWHWLRRGLRMTAQGLIWVYLGLALGHTLTDSPGSPFLSGWEDSLEGLGLLCAGSSIQVSHDEANGRYTAELQGRFTLSVTDSSIFVLRFFVIFLLLLDDPVAQRGSRRTRDGRTPCLREEAVAKALGLCQPHISLWLKWFLAGDWRRLLSQRAQEVLTLELQQRIIETCAHFPHWSTEQVHRFLVQQGLGITLSQVQQAAHESGWQIVRQVLARLCVQRAEELRLREDWLVGDLLAQVQELLQKVETGQKLTTEEQLEVQACRVAVQEAGLQAKPPAKAVPWLRQLESVLFEPWVEVTAEGVHCPDCGSSHVGRKGLKARRKKFVDAQGQVQEVDVYRYRCHNAECRRESFTAFPTGLLPYSPQRLEVHLLALQMYAWGYSTYRRTGRALGVAKMTAYRWVSAFGYRLLPVAALFGMVRSSGVVGVDEKWVLVPKNNKPAGKHRKWMYVYLAVDVYTYDLLHIAIYPHNTIESAQAFLLALRSKGYHPRVVVTDLRQDYGPAIAHVFPRAQHHECLFHASQALHRHLAKVYGWDALQNNERVVALCQALDGPLQAHTKRTANERYAELMAQRDTWVKEKPQLGAVFDCLEAHWPKLVNGIESDLIPTTNNAVETVILRFDQHYQNFRGFDSLESAERFLGVFEKVYRFTPFSDDAQPRIRGKSPLQLAGYDVTNLPIAAACSGWAIAPPVRAPHGSVPNV